MSAPTTPGEPLGFDAVWDAIKGWDICRDGSCSYHGTTGDDVRTILAALTAAGFPPRSDAEVAAQVAAAVLAEREACAHVAADACLVPPDGGSPTEAEYEVAKAAAERIRSRSAPTIRAATATDHTLNAALDAARAVMWRYRAGRLRWLKEEQDIHAEIPARLSQEAEIPAAIAAFLRSPGMDGFLGGAQAVATAIHARPAPSGADALAAMLAQAKGAAFDEGRESAFAQMRRPGEIETNMAVGHLPRDWFDAKLAAARREGIEAAADVCDELHEHTPGVCAAAIRALLPAPDAALAQDFTAWTDGGTHE